MERPCEPSDVNWENVSISATNKYCRVISFLAFLTVALYGTYMQQQELYDWKNFYIQNFEHIEC